jgi:hypothetical protein
LRADDSSNSGETRPGRGKTISGPSLSPRGVVRILLGQPAAVEGLPPALSEVSGFFTSFHERLFLLLWMAKRARGAIEGSGIFTDFID